ncbi:hypothetical protein EU800_24900 [Tropicimonas sp. IMCC6043]|nr:hypothetical protein EU800_24900 [Tropicimonas sp. IMCC6043]
MGLITYFRDRKVRSAATTRHWDNPAWWRDPLSHPDIRRMSPRELADLPFDRSEGVHRSSAQSHLRRWQ